VKKVRRSGVRGETRRGLCSKGFGVLLERGGKTGSRRSRVTGDLVPGGKGTIRMNHSADTSQRVLSIQKGGEGTRLGLSKE